jgi:uncharacterized Zn-binding protein involved in type VI secretion
MGEAAVVRFDRITGTCPGHLVPGPAGAAVPGPPMPFSAPLTQGLSTSVRLQGEFAAIVGSSGSNSPPHVGLHASDPWFAPPAQQGRVTGGSSTVLIENTPAAKTGSPCSCCTAPGQLAGSAVTVLIGG